jgi:HSP20 family protein
MRIARYRTGIPELTLQSPFDMPNRMQRLFSDLLGPMQTEGLGWSPQVDILETDEELVLRADLPGLKKDDVDLEVTDGALIMKGEKKEEKEEKGAQYRIVERTYGAFERSFALPNSVDAEKIRADFSNGVLEVHLPKTEKAVGRRVLIGEKH